MGELQLLQTTAESQASISQARLETSLKSLADPQRNDSLSGADGKRELGQFGELLADTTADGESIESSLDFYKSEGLVIDSAQEQTIINNAEFKKYGLDTYVDRTIQRTVINAVVREAALRRIAGGKLDDEFIDDMQSLTRQSVSGLTEFLNDKKVEYSDVGSAQQKADEYLRKTIHYYTNHDVQDLGPETQKRHTVERLRGLGRGILESVAEKGKSVVEALIPSRNALKRVGRFAVHSTVIASVVVVASVAGEMSRDSPKDKTEESVDSDGLIVSANNTTEIDSDVALLDTFTTPERIDIETTVPEAVDQTVTDATVETIPAVPKPEHPPLTAEQQAIVDQTQETLLDIVDKGEKTLKELSRNRVGSLTMSGICMDNIDVFVANAVDPVHSPGVLDDFNWDSLNTDPSLPYVVIGDYEAARERLNPLYRARMDETPQIPCEMEGKSEYTERWLMPTKGSSEARTIAAHPSELAPAATLHPDSSLPGRAGVKVVEAHRTTESAAFVNTDALLPGQTAEFSDGNTSYSYNFVGFREVSPDILIDEIRALYAGDDDTLILSTCDDGSSVRLLSVFSRSV
jgi:hypothetical protein